MWAVHEHFEIQPEGIIVWHELIWRPMLMQDYCASLQKMLGNASSIAF